MSRSRRFQLVDVFHDAPLSGNPLAVVFDAEGLGDEEMQRITRWLNLSETTFILPPTTGDADYRVRIFTLDRELPFAGHPTLGTCHAWLLAGGRPRRADRIVQECPAGLVRIRSGGERLAFAAPPLVRSGAASEDEIHAAAAILRIARSEILAAEWTDNGPGWMSVLLGSAAAVLAVEPVREHPALVHLGLVGPHPAGSPCAFELRAIFSDHRGALIEDPVTGSLNAAVAQWLLGSGRASSPYIACQGAKLGRAGRIHVDRDADGIWIGGRTTSLSTGRWQL